MKKTTIARVIATAASTAGAIVCPKVFENQYADVAIKTGVATLLSSLPDTISWGWKKAKEVELEAEITTTRTPEGIPHATVTKTDITASINDGVVIDTHKDADTAETSATSKQKAKNS